VNLNESGNEALETQMDSTDLVVRQDKGNESVRLVRSCFSFSLRPFPESHYDTSEFIVTQHNWVTVTRAISPRLRGSWEWSQPVWSAITTLIAGTIFLVLAARVLHLRIMLTNSSAAAGVYRVTDFPVARSALVAACLPLAIARQGLARGYLQRGDCPAGAEPVAKVVGAIAGDVVELEPGWVAVNGVKFSNSQMASRDSANRPLSHASLGERRVGEGEVWLFGFNNARSWDARYFGPIPSTNLRGVLKPVVTW
jgi:conjugative transfer signal peptidase TraF